jgi:GAF domain-containing protein
MRSRAVQLALAAVALAAVISTAFFVNVSEQHIATARTSARAFDAVVRETTNSVAEFRSDAVKKSMDALRSMATTDKAKASVDQAASKADNFTEIAAVLDQINTARAAEQQTADDTEGSERRLEATALGGAAIIGLAAIAGILIAAPKTVAPTSPAPGLAADVKTSAGAEETPMGYVTARPAGPVLRAASQLCTDLGRVSDVEELRGLVGRAAELMDASGLIVWMSVPDGNQLVPALSHGYSVDMMSRLPPLARSADNAAATAYRTSQLQIVLARPGASNGAIVAPVLSPNGCVGVISAEIRGGGETSESVQALAAIFAAQLASVLHTTPESKEQRATGT